MLKKIVSVCLAACLVCAGCALAEEGCFVSYHSDFSAGTDGWYARSAGGAAVSVTEEGLKITGRTASWNSPGRDFPLQAGKEYALSVRVRQESQATANFMISVAHSKAGTESYENLATGAAKKGEWTTVAGTWTPGEYDNYILYVETAGSDTLDFTIADFTVELNEVRLGQDDPSLKEAFAPWFLLGTAVTQGEALNTQRMDAYSYHFGIYTPGNELKPDSVLDVAASMRLAKEDDTAVAVRFDAAKPLLSYCRDHGLPVHGHVLVWHSQTPEAFFHKGYKASAEYVSRETMLARLDNYIRQIMAFMDQNYPGLIVSWDVVNEAIDDSTGQLRQSNWTKVVGDDFVERAFEIARKYAPKDVKLYYNDYNTPIAPKTDGILALLARLTAEGNIDGYGFQAHYSATSPAPSRIRAAMEQVEALGLRVRISELDVTIDGNTELNLKVQAIRYADLFKIFMEHAEHLDAVQLWGVSDDLSWRASQYPLLFDRLLKPKPAFHSVLELAKAE